MRAEGTDSLKVNWTELESQGPLITAYEVRYRQNGEEGYRDGGDEGIELTLDVNGPQGGSDHH